MMTLYDYYMALTLARVKIKYEKWNLGVLVELDKAFFQPVTADIFLISPKKICCGYSLEVPWRGFSNDFIFFFILCPLQKVLRVLYYSLWNFLVSHLSAVHPPISTSIIHVRFITLIQSRIFSRNFSQMCCTMRRRAELRYHNSGLPTFGVIALWTLNIAISTMYKCTLCKLKTVQDIITKFLTNVKHHETTQKQ